MLQQLKMPTNLATESPMLSAMTLSDTSADRILLGMKTKSQTIDIFRIDMTNGAFQYSTSVAKTIELSGYDVRAVHQDESSNCGYFVVTQHGQSNRVLVYDFASSTVTDFEMILTSQMSWHLYISDFDAAVNSIQFTQTNDICIAALIGGFGSSTTGVAACSHTSRRSSSSSPLLQESSINNPSVTAFSPFTELSLQITDLDTATQLNQMGDQPLTSDTHKSLASQDAYPQMLNFTTNPTGIDPYMKSPSGAMVQIDEPPTFTLDSVLPQNVTIGSELAWAVYFLDESPETVQLQLQIEDHPEISLFYEGPYRDPNRDNSGSIVMRSDPLPFLSSKEKHYISLRLTDQHGQSSFYRRAIELRFYSQAVTSSLLELYPQQSQTPTTADSSSSNDKDCTYDADTDTTDCGSTTSSEYSDEQESYTDEDSSSDKDSLDFADFADFSDFSDFSDLSDIDMDAEISDMMSGGGKSVEDMERFEEMMGEEGDGKDGGGGKGGKGKGGKDGEDYYDEEEEYFESEDKTDETVESSAEKEDEEEQQAQQTQIETTFAYSKEEIDAKWEVQRQIIVRQYSTPEKILQLYGGPVATKKPKINQFGQFTATFSRPIYFPRELLAKYGPKIYLEKPNIQPSDAYMESFEKDFYASFQGMYDPNEGSRRRNLQYKDEHWTGEADLNRSIQDRIRFEIDIDQDDPEILAKMRQFTFKVTKLSHQSIEIEFTFENPSLFGSKSGKEILLGRADFSDFEPSWNDEKIFFKKRIIKQIDRNSKNLQLASQLGNMGQGSQTAAVASVASNFLLSSCMAQIWGMINGIQLLVHLPILAVDFPIFSQIFIDQLITIATFDLIDTDGMFDDLFEIPADPEETIPPQFYNVGYQSNFLIKDLGLSWIVLAFGIVFCLLAPLVLLLCKCQKIQTKFAGWQSSMYFGFYLRYLVETFIEVLICAYIDFYSKYYHSQSTAALQDDRTTDTGNKEVVSDDVTKDEQSGQSENFTFFVWLNRVFLILFCAIIVVLPLGVLAFYRINFKKWENDSFEKRYGAVLENLNLQKACSLFYPFFFLVRRIGMLYVALFDHQQVYVQVIFQLVTVQIQLVYLVQFRPFLEPQAQNLDIFNELTTMGLSYFILCFSNANPVAGGTQNFDWFFIVILGGNIATHLLIIIFGQAHIMKLKCKKSYEMRKQRKFIFQKKGPKVQFYPTKSSKTIKTGSPNNHLRSQYMNEISEIKEDIMEDYDDEFSIHSDKKLVTSSATSSKVGEGTRFSGEDQDTSRVTSKIVNSSNPQNLPWMPQNVQKKDKIIRAYRASIGDAFSNLDKQISDRLSQMNTHRELEQIEEINGQLTSKPNS